jgi:hypothetical protein
VRVTVSAIAFKQWATDAGLPVGAAPLARLIGVSRTTLQAQFLRGRLHESIVVSAAREVATDPVVVLATFDPYEDLLQSVMPPTPREILSQVTLVDAVVELVSRSNEQYAAALSPVHRWEDPPQPDSIRNWIDAIDPGDLRRELATRIGMAPSNVSTAITANKLKPRALVEAARIAGTSSLTGLAAGGLLTLQEARWPDDARRASISALAIVDLNELVQARLSSSQRAARRLAADAESARRIEESLG